MGDTYGEKVWIWEDLRLSLRIARVLAQPASDPPKICQARTLFATRLRTR